MMKLARLLLLLCLGATGLVLTSCETVRDEETGRISADGVGYTRESVYEWQDRTFRQLAY